MEGEAAVRAFSLTLSSALGVGSLVGVSLHLALNTHAVVWGCAYSRSKDTMADVGAADMVNLTVLDETTLVENLKVRFDAGEVYTTCGRIVVSVNPFRWLPIYGEDLIKQYHAAGDPFNTEPPLPLLMEQGFITPAALHYVRNHGERFVPSSWPRLQCSWCV